MSSTPVTRADGTLASLAASASPAVPDGDLGLIELARRAEASDLGGGTLELLQASADRLCRDYPTVDPHALSRQARTRLGYVTDLLGRRVTLAQHRELLVAAGWLSALLACTCYDSGNHRAGRGRSQYDTAVRGPCRARRAGRVVV